MKYTVKTESDKLYAETATTLANTWMENVKKIAVEKNLDIQKDFRKILTMIKNEEMKNGK